MTFLSLLFTILYKEFMDTLVPITEINKKIDANELMHFHWQKGSLTYQFHLTHVTNNYIIAIYIIFT